MITKNLKNRIFNLVLIITIGLFFSNNSYGNEKIINYLGTFSNTDSSISYQTKSCIKFRSYDGESKIEVKYMGEITVSDDDTKIKSISPGGYLRFSKKTFGNKRTINIDSDNNGKLKYEYYEGRKEISFEPEGRRWLEDILLEVIRASGIDAEGRVERIYAKSGINGVISEIKEMKYGNIINKYFSSLLKNNDLNEKETKLVCEKITILIPSNTDRATLYRKYADVFMKTNDLTCTYFNCVSSLCSNTERASIFRNIEKEIDFSDDNVIDAYFNSINKLTSSIEAGSTLRHLVKNQQINDKAMVAMLRCIRRISSNTEVGSTMRNLENVNFSNPDILSTYFEVVNTITSNTEAGSILKKLIREQELDNQTMVELLRTVKKLTSNTEIGSILRKIKNIDFENDEVRIAYFAVINTMTSNTEEGSVLRYTLNSFELNKAAFLDFYYTTKRLTSNTELGLVIRESINMLPYDDDILAAFFLAVNSILSNTEHGRVLRMLLDKENIPEKVIIMTLESTKKILSNIEIGSVLIKVCEMGATKNEEVRAKYLEIAKNLNSNSEYKRVMDCLN